MDGARSSADVKRPRSSFARALYVASLVFLSVGCSDAGDASPDGGGPFIGPILERPGRQNFTCRVTRELMNRKPTHFGHWGASLATLPSGDVWGARLQATGSEPWIENPWIDPGSYSLLVSTVAADGQLGSAKTIAVSDPSRVTSPEIVALPSGGFAVVWLEGERLRFASFDAAGAPRVAPKDLPAGSVGSSTRIRLALSARGSIGIVWELYETREVRFLSIDPSGETSMTAPIRFSRDAFGPSIVAAKPDGFALTWTEIPQSPGSSSVHFARFGDNGEPIVADKTVSEPTGMNGGFNSLGPALIPMDSGYVIAWSEGSYGNYETSTGGYSVIRMLKLDGKGTPQGAAPMLRTKTDDIDEVEPNLIQFGTAIGMLWGRGSHIYVCAGCVPNHSIELVLLDPDSMVPVSNVVKIPAPELGGLLNKHVAVTGPHVLTDVNITYHVSSDSAFAAFRCE
jgi:hypothetical protein